MQMSNRGGMPAPESVKIEEDVEKVGLQSSQTAVVKSDSEKVVTEHSRGIKVVAKQAGFFKGYRRKEDDKFFVGEESELGMWMKCEDPEIQERHEARIKKHKALVLKNKKARKISR
jgi:hypothetical protein